MKNKVMEIPEKIYLTSNDNEAFVFTQKRTDNKGVEYTRTDAFIEKAVEWLKKEVVEDYKGVLWENLIEDFKNYMKGE